MTDKEESLEEVLLLCGEVDALRTEVQRLLFNVDLHHQQQAKLPLSCPPRCLMTKSVYCITMCLSRS